MAELSRGEINDLVAGFASRNPRYREALVRDPKTVIERQFNKRLPDGLSVRVVEETADTVYVVVPYVPPTAQELSDDELELVAGGFKDNNCNNARGGINTHVEVKLA